HELPRDGHRRNGPRARPRDPPGDDPHVVPDRPHDDPARGPEGGRLRRGEPVVTQKVPGLDGLTEIARGGMGVVYRGRDAQGRDVAVKVLNRLASAEVAARFEREQRLLAAFGEAEGFVQRLDTGDTPSGPFIVMRFLPGGTLRRRLR